MSSLTTCSHRLRVAKGHTGALFLLILMETFSMGCLDIRRSLSGCVLWLRRTDGCGPIGSPNRRVDDVRLDRPPATDIAFFLAINGPSFDSATVVDSLVAAFSLALVVPVKSPRAAEPNERYSRRPVTYPIPHGTPIRDFPPKGFSPILTMVTYFTLLILMAPTAAR